MEYTIIIPTLESKQNKDRDKSAFVSRRNSKCENRSLHRLLRDVDQPQISAERFWLVFEALLKAGGRDRDTRAFTCRNMHKHTLVSYRTFLACLYDKSPCDCHIIDNEDLACMHLFQKSSTTGESWKHPTIFLFQTVPSARTLWSSQPCQHIHTSSPSGLRSCCSISFFFNFYLSSRAFSHSFILQMDHQSPSCTKSVQTG